MEFQRQKEVGRRLLTVLTNWIEKSPELAMYVVKPMFLANSFKMKNEERFVAAFYGQNILEESPSDLSQRFPSTFLKVQHVMEISLNKRNVKGLIVALVVSDNQSLLSDLLSWTENNSKEIEDSIKSVPPSNLAWVKVLQPKRVQERVKVLSSVDLAPVKVQKRKALSEIISRTVLPRHREICWIGGEEKQCTALEVWNNKIIVGWNNGQVQIYDSANLDCQTVLNYSRSTAHVTCLQCTGVELIAGYDDGNIFVWNIQSGVLAQTLSVADGICGRHFPTCMRWRDPKLVVGTAHGRIHIWQNLNSCFNPLDCWDADDSYILDVDFNENYVIFAPCGGPESVKVHYFNGQQFRSISSRGGILQMALHENLLITCDRYGTLQIWNISTGGLLVELTGQGIRMFGFDSHDGIIVAGSRRERVIIWNIQAALQGSVAELVRLPHRHIKCVPFDAFVKEIKVGPSVLVARSMDGRNQSKIFVTDFLL